MREKDGHSTAIRRRKKPIDGVATPVVEAVNRTKSSQFSS